MKKWIVAVLSVTLCLLLAVGTVNFLVDPLMHYRILPSRFTFVAYAYDYINPGIAKNADYDAVLVGTSLAENSDMDVYESAFGCRMIRMIFPGCTTRSYALILDTVFQSHEPEKILWTIDDELFNQDGSSYTHEMPEYLYDENILNDVSYLLNLTVFYNYTFKDTALSLVGRSNRPILRGDVWSHVQAFGRDEVMKKQPSDVEKAPDAIKPDDWYMDNVEDNLQTHILPLLRAHSETQFYFYFPPKCVTYWRAALHNGEFDAKFSAMRRVMQALFTCDNARVFFFADRMEWTTDFDLYKDNVHFTQSVNNAMGEAMAAGESELTPDTYAQTLQTCAQTLRQTAQAIRYGDS